MLEKQPIEGSSRKSGFCDWGLRGLGRAIALRFGSAGAAVAITDGMLLENVDLTEDELKIIDRIGRKTGRGFFDS